MTDVGAFIAVPNCVGNLATLIPFGAAIACGNPGTIPVGGWNGWGEYEARTAGGTAVWLIVLLLRGEVVSTVAPGVALSRKFSGREIDVVVIPRGEDGLETVAAGMVGDIVLFVAGLS